MLALYAIKPTDFPEMVGGIVVSEEWLKVRHSTQEKIGVRFVDGVNDRELRGRVWHAERKIPEGRVASVGGFLYTENS